MEAEIKFEIFVALNASELKDKVENLQVELAYPCWKQLQKIRYLTKLQMVTYSTYQDFYFLNHAAL